MSLLPHRRAWQCTAIGLQIAVKVAMQEFASDWQGQGQPFDNAMHMSDRTPCCQCDWSHNATSLTKKPELTNDLLEFDEVTVKTLEHFEQIADKGTRGTKRLRSKKKWKIAKAWRHLKPTVFYNHDKLAFTKTLFIHHQLHKALVQGPHVQCRWSLISLKDLDHRKGLTYAELHSRDRQSHKHGKQRCVRQETQHTLKRGQWFADWSDRHSHYCTASRPNTWGLCTPALIRWPSKA